MDLKNTDDMSEQMRKMLEATNKVVGLTEQLIQAGTDLNEKRGKYHEIKARIKAQKEIISSLKEIIKAERF